MQRIELEHAIRAAGNVTEMDDFIILGSQAILGQFPSAPAVFLKSHEVDMYPRLDPKKAEEIDGSLGEGSPFHELHRFYVHGVGPETAVLPSGWENRLIVVRNENTDNKTGRCLEVHDLAVSKLVAGREKDMAFVRALISHKMVNPARLTDLVKTLPVSSELYEIVQARVWRLEGETEAPNPPLSQSLDAGAKADQAQRSIDTGKP
jgi:hypothetical protein